MLKVTNQDPVSKNTEFLANLRNYHPVDFSLKIQHHNFKLCFLGFLVVKSILDPVLV